MRASQARAATTSSGSSVFLRAASSNPYRGRERRKHKRVPKSIGIIVEPLDIDQVVSDRSFFAITRDVSDGGLAFLCPFHINCEMLLLSLEEDPRRGVVSRVCNCCLVHASELEQVYLTSVEFLYERHI